jgi:hypothetical protein
MKRINLEQTTPRTIYNVKLTFKTGPVVEHPFFSFSLEYMKPNDHMTVEWTSPLDFTLTDEGMRNLVAVQVLSVKIVEDV